MTISSSFELGSGSSGNTNQPRERENITRMDQEFYEAAAKGDIEFFKVHGTDLNVLLTPNKNTVLHIYITALVAEAKSPTNFIDEVLKRHPLLLWQANANDEIPLHIAARYGHTAVIKFLLERANDLIHQDHFESGFRSAKEMLRMTNKEKDTALHEAVRYKHVEAAKLLVEEDKEFSYLANAAGETPLYMAAERNFLDIVLKIINTCKSPAYGGPLGRTALHAAACWEDEAMINIMIQRISGISKEADDEEGWTPLHLAAYYNYTGSTMLLLEYDRDVAYMKATEGRTALLIAAHRGHFKLMEKIISSCPDCCELVDNRGWNALHFVLGGPILYPLRRRHDERVVLIRAILNNTSLSNLLNQKDADGNTPLHHLFCSSWFMDQDFMMPTTDHNKLRLDLFVEHRRVDKMAFNKKHLSAYENALSSTGVSTQKRTFILNNVGRRSHGRRVPSVCDNSKEEKEKKVKESLQKVAKTHLVVATLITTVTFAAAIALPGGFVSEDDHDKSQRAGSPVLRTSSAFKAFIITDALSMLWIPSNGHDYDGAGIYYGHICCLGAFLGSCRSHCIIGLSFFLVFVLICRKIFSAIMHGT